MEPSEQPKSNRGIYILVIVVVLLLAGATVYALQNSQPDTVNTETTQTETTTTESTDSASDADTAPAPSERMAIAYTDNGFEPQEVTVKKGTTITVTNNSSKDVQFSSDDHPVHRDNPEMNLKTLSPGESTSYTPTEAGTWGFHDHIDDSKTGTVTVTE